MSALVAAQRIEAVSDKLLIFAGKSEGERRWIAAGLAKYGEIFLEAERRKLVMRKMWADDDSWKLGWDRYRPLWREFWEEYEEINRELLPDDPVYSLTRSGVALSTTVDHWTLTVGTAGQLRILESYISGEATVSAIARTGIALASTNGTTPTAYTPEKFNSRSPSAVATVATNWTTQPTRSANNKVLHAMNAFGGVDRWVPQPGEEAYMVGTGTSEQFSHRSISGTSTVSSHAIWEEL
jgi:hypothetical protein